MKVSLTFKIKLDRVLVSVRDIDRTVMGLFVACKEKKLSIILINRGKAGDSVKVIFTS